MASEEEQSSDAGSDQPPTFPKGKRPSTGTDIGFDESTSGSEAPPSEAPPIDEKPRPSTSQRPSQEARPSTLLPRPSPEARPSTLLPRPSQEARPSTAFPRPSQEARASTLQRASQEARPSQRASTLLQRGSQSKSGSRGEESGRGSKSMRKYSVTDGRPPRRQWDSQRASKGIEHVDMEMPETRELLRRLKEVEELESSSSSGGHAASAKLASPKPGEHHRGIKALHRAVQENEMPMRMAYEQLDELAANADRVKFAIEKNRSLLVLQVKKTNERVLRVAFMAWSLEVEYQNYKKLQLRRALTWSIRSLESRAFKGWSRSQKLGKKNRRFEASATHMLQHRKLSQTWKAWRGFIADIRRKHEDVRKEKKLRKRIDKTFREDLAKRAAYIIRRSMLRRYFRFFQEGVDARIQARAFLKQVLILLLKKSAFRAFVALRDAARKRAHDRKYIKARVRGMQLKKCLKAWWRLLERNRHFRRTAPENHLIHSTFLQWRNLVRAEKYRRTQWIGNFRKLDRKMLHRRFLMFVEVVRARKCVRGLVRRQLEKLGRRLVNRCFKRWISFMQVEALKKVQQVKEHASLAEKENEKLRSDNERLSTIIDTGEWNKERVSDLKAAQEVLSTERVALTKLIGRLQRQHQSALDQQEQQEHEIKQLKGQLVTENNYFERNKLLVKGASSFNTLMKVMKHDLTKKGMTTVPVTPEVSYEVNNMAMDQVSVFPDGELHVKAFTPRAKGIWSTVMSNSATTRTPSVRSPSAMSNRGVPGGPFSAPKTPRKSSLRAPSPQTIFRGHQLQTSFREPRLQTHFREPQLQANFREPQLQTSFRELPSQASFGEPPSQGSFRDPISQQPQGSFREAPQASFGEPPSQGSFRDPISQQPQGSFREAPQASLQPQGGLREQPPQASVVGSSPLLPSKLSLKEPITSPLPPKPSLRAPSPSSLPSKSPPSAYNKYFREAFM